MRKLLIIYLFFTILLISGAKATGTEQKTVSYENKDQNRINDVNLDGAPRKSRDTLPDGTIVYLVPDTMASFPDGIKEMSKFIVQNMRGLDRVLDFGVLGTVYVKTKMERLPILWCYGGLINYLKRKSYELLI